MAGMSEFLSHLGSLTSFPKVTTKIDSSAVLGDAREDTRARLAAAINRPSLVDILPSPNEAVAKQRMSDYDLARKKFDSDYFMACEAFKTQALTEHKKSKFMLRALGRLGCSVDPWKFVNCVPCVDEITGAFHSVEDGTYEVIMCQNFIQSQAQFNQVLTHELVHAYDACRANLDLTNCKQHACTEVRASTLSGDCDFWEEVFRGDSWKIPGLHRKCVRRRAIKSVRFNPHCTGQEELVDEVFDQCYADLAPFGAIP
jgi:inner membrane protease ATP23